MLGKRTLAGQLLTSHLSVASIGLGMLFITLLSTYGLRSRVILVASDSGPLAQASLQVLAGVQHSLAGLRGWVSLGDKQLLQEWRSAWRDDIEPAVALLRGHASLLEEFGETARLQSLRLLLEDLREAQWWVADVAHTPGNEPARITYAVQVEPVATAMDAMLGAIIDEEKAQEAGEERKLLLAELSEAQRAFAVSHLLLRETVGPSGLNYARRFQEQWRLTRTGIERIARADPLLTAEQSHLLNSFRNNLQVFETLAQEIMQQRRSPNWNVARYLLTTETGPLAAQVINLAEGMASRFATLMEQEAEAARLASAITVWLLIGLILIMLVVAYAVSRVRAQTLAQPIAALSKASQQLAGGELVNDIPVTRDDELGELTRAFNTMRASLLQAHEELREANVSLEQRVAKRTQELEQANAELIREVSVRRQAEEALREREARLTAIGNAVPDFIFVLDEDGRYLEVLTSQQYLVNARVASLNGKLLSEVHPREMADYFLSIIRQALTTQRIQVAEYELEVSSGRRWFESRTAPIVLPSAVKPAVIVVSRDITQRKLAEERLRQAQKMEAIGHLTGGVAHDFNNLLAIVLGNLELLQEHLVKQPQLQDLVHRALNAADRGAILVQRLLAFSRQQPLRAQPTDLSGLVTGMIDLLRRTLGETIHIETAFAEDLWRPLVDPAQLENALLNLALNARDAMPCGGQLTIETANVRLDAAYAAAHEDVQAGDYVMLAVSDTGVGMAPAVLDRAFEPFFTTKEVGKGSGLGLSMVYGLVKQSGGCVSIYSREEQGTTVKVYLPRAGTALPDATEASSPEPLRQGRAELILVVEDDANVRQLAVNMLTSLGYRTVQAGDSEEALRTLDEQPEVALLFTDVVLPGGVNGAELAREAQRRWPDLKVLFTSGYTATALAHQGRLGTAVELISKPYRKNDLASKLRAMLATDA